MMVVSALAVEPALAIVRPVAVIPVRSVDDDVVMVAMVVAIDMDVAAPVEVAAVVLGGRRGRGEDQADGDQGRNADTHGSFLKG
ncbi:hypothetical protein FV220_20315 [Methylobacterium sp. WL19]|nr:hypothetical protein FV218_00460 [Methylobacterium sp. WL69]TXN24372.1 hypothetical protein FV220_20315 [Methylobacterium sp. WL19]